MPLSLRANIFGQCFGVTSGRHERSGKKGFIAAVDAWAEKGQSGEQRDVAKFAILDVFRRGAKRLELPGLGLTSLPPLPSVSELDASFNCLETAPDLSGLKYADLRGNRINSLPDLPPDSEVKLQDNQICAFLASQLPRTCRIDLTGNPLVPTAARYVEVHDTLPGYAEIDADTREKWHGILNGAEEKERRDANQFLAFLEKLPQFLRRTPADFQADACVWLTRLAQSETLRGTVFGLAIEANASCRDGTLLAFNQMRTALAGEDAGLKYKGNIPGLITLARQIFRLEHLQEIGAELVIRLMKEVEDEWLAFGLSAEESKRLALQIVDPVEVELRLGVELRGRLALGTEVRGMYYPDSSRLLKTDIGSAERRVKIKENHTFLRWLANWPAWDDAVSHMDGALHAEAENERHEKLEELIAACAKPCLTQTASQATIGDAGANSHLARQSADLSDRVLMRRNKAFAERNGCADLLEPFWNLRTGKPVRKPAKAARPKAPGTRR